jgi:hypothetical protein
MDKDMDMDVVENMKTWTRTWKHGRGHGNMDEDRETWTRTWKEHRRKQTWKHGLGHGGMVGKRKTENESPGDFL